MRLYVKDFLTSRIYDANRLRASEGYSTLCGNERLLEQLDKMVKYYILFENFNIKVGQKLVGVKDRSTDNQQHKRSSFYVYL